MLKKLAPLAAVAALGAVAAVGAFTPATGMSLVHHAPSAIYTIRPQPTCGPPVVTLHAENLHPCPQ